MIKTDQPDAILRDIEQGKRYKVTITPDRAKRSMTANAYLWVLLDKLTQHTGLPREDIYREYVKNVGGNTDILCLRDKSVDAFRETWARNGTGWVTEVMDSKIDGCTNVKVYYGSSTFDTKTLARMNEMVEADCKDCGIETRSEEELQSLLDSWGGK